MKYAIITVTDGTYLVREEGITDVSTAKKRYHYWCNLLWSEASVINAEVAIVDENLDAVEGYKEFIHHEAVAPVEPVEEPTE